MTKSSSCCTSTVVRVPRHGDADVLELVSVDVPTPGPGEVLIEQRAVGLNYLDIYMRKGMFPLPLPSGLGTEATGEVVAVGAGVSTCRLGDRVAYATSKPGAYAQRRVVPSNILVPLPDALSFDQVASLLLRGLTAQCLLRQVARTQAGDTILVHAAAGGVGTLLVQWAKALGAMVIGTVGSRAKGALARSRGCDHVIVRTEEDLVSRVRALTSGNGVDVVFDSVGRDSFIPSLDCLRRHGLMVNYGSTSGLLEHINPIDLTRRGSLRFIRPTVSDYVADPGVLAQMAAELFNEVLNGRISLDVPSRYAMADVVLAHHAVDSGQTMGAIVLLP